MWMTLWRATALLVAVAVILQVVETAGVEGSPLPLPLQRRNDAPLYIGTREGWSEKGGNGRSQLDRRDEQISMIERNGAKRSSIGKDRLAKRQLLPLPASHPLTFVPGGFTRDAAAKACGPGKQLAAVDVRTARYWGDASS
jgi:hypothetical protein